MELLQDSPHYQKVNELLILACFVLIANTICANDGRYSYELSNFIFLVIQCNCLK